MKVLLCITILTIILIVVYYVIKFTTSYTYAIAGRCELKRLMRNIIAVIKHQQQLLSQLGITVNTGLSLDTFDMNITKAYNKILIAYNDNINHVSSKYSEQYIQSVRDSFENNICTLNILIYDYNVNNVMYSKNVDELHLFGEIFKRYLFIDSDARITSDHGIAGSSILSYH